MSLSFEGDDVSEVVDMLRKIEVYVRSANEQLEHSDSKCIADLLKTSKLVQGPPLRSHQLEGIRWIIDLYKNGLNGILADEMGLGKTAQVLAAMALMAENGSPGPFLVIVPLSLLYSWSEQLNTFTPDLPHILYYGSATERSALRKQIKPERQSFKQSSKLKKKKELSSYHSDTSSATNASKKRQKYTKVTKFTQNIANKSKFSIPKTVKMPHKNTVPFITVDSQGENQTPWKSGFLSIISFDSSSQYRTDNTILNNFEETLDEVLSKKLFCPSKELSRIRKNLDDYSLEYQQTIHSLSTPERQKDTKQKVVKPKKAKVPTIAGVYESNAEYLANLDKVIDTVLAGNDELSLPARFDSQFSSEFDENSTSFSTTSDFTDDRFASTDIFRPYISTAQPQNKLSLKVKFNQSLNNIQYNDCGEVSRKTECDSQSNTESEILTNNLPNLSDDLSVVKTKVVNADNNISAENSTALMQPLYSEVQRGIERISIGMDSMVSMQASLKADDLFYSASSSPIQIYQDFEKNGDKEIHTNESINNLSQSFTKNPKKYPELSLETVQSSTEDKLSGKSHIVSQSITPIDQAYKKREFGTERSQSELFITYKIEDLNKMKEEQIKLSEIQEVQSGIVQEGISGFDSLSSSKNDCNVSVKVRGIIVDRVTDDTSQAISIDSLNPMLSIKSSDEPIETIQNGEIDKLSSDAVSAGEEISGDQCQISIEDKDFLPETLTNSVNEGADASEFQPSTEYFSVNLNESIDQNGEIKFISTDNLSNDNRDMQTKTEENEIESANGDQMGTSEIQGLQKGFFPVVITTYEVAIRDCSFLSRINFKAMVVDEAQRIKGAASKLYQCLQTYDADVRLIVTGTPLQNSISELWRLLHFLLPEIFPMVADFARWFDPATLVDQMGRDRLAAQEAEHALITNLRNIIHPFMLRRIKAQVDFKLPPKREIILRVLMTPEQQELHDHVVRTLLENGTIATPTKHFPGSITALDRKNILNDGCKRRAANSHCNYYDERGSESSLETPPLPARRIDNFNEVAGPKRPKRDPDLPISENRSEEIPHPKKRGRPRKAKATLRPVNNISPPRQIESPKPSFKFLKSAESSSKLMLLRRLANHSYLILERPESLNLFKEGNQSEEEKKHGLAYELLRMGGKLALLDRLLKKLIATGHKTLIFSQFTMVLDVIEELMEARGWNWVRLDGAVRIETRQEVVHEFNTSSAEELPIFLLSTRSGGLGLNLQASADTVIIHDSDWNPQLDLQAMDRCHRLGQEKPVLVIRFLTANSIEEHIYARALAKRGLERLLLHGTSKPTTFIVEVEGEIEDQASKGGLVEEIDFSELLNNPTTATESTVDALSLTDAEIDQILNRGFASEAPVISCPNITETVDDESKESVISEQTVTADLGTSKITETLPDSGEADREKASYNAYTSASLTSQSETDLKTLGKCTTLADQLAESTLNPDPSTIKNQQKSNKADQSNLLLTNRQPDNLRKGKTGRLGLGRSRGTFKTPFKKPLKPEE